MASKISTLEQLEGDATAWRLDLRIVVKRRATGEVLGEVGGVYDRVRGCYLEGERAERGKVFWVNEAQALGEVGGTLEDGPISKILQWIEARRSGSPRVIELVLDGARGSGKSHLGVLAVFLIAVAFPGARCLLISPANTRREELATIVRDWIPRAWRAWQERDLRYTLPNGSTVTYVGADDEDALKQGGFEVALLNEAQLVTSTAYVNTIGGVRNVSGRPKGLLILAMNYAAKERGEWTNDHLDKIEAGGINAIRCRLDPKLNENIEAGVVDEIDQAARSVRPDLADLDSLGIRKRLGDYATPAFKPHRVEFGGHVGAPPAGWRDVTRDVTAERTGTRDGFALVVGADFQRRPGCVATVMRLFERPSDRKLVYFVEHCIVAGDNEDDLCRRLCEYLETRSLGPRDVLVVADSSGRWQDAQHRQNAKPSHEIMREWYFTVVAPRKVKARGGFGNKNPEVEESLAQFYDLCTDGRFLVSDPTLTPSTEFLVEAHRRCKIKKRGGTIRLDDRAPGYSHPVDCDRYVTWYFEPRRGPAAEPADRSADAALRRVKILTRQ